MNAHPEIQSVLASNEASEQPIAAEEQVIDYSVHLNGFNVDVSATGEQLLVGEIPSGPGWTLHLSIVTNQRANLLDSVIPEFVAQKIPFKFAKTSEAARAINNGYTGPGRMGKFISVYPHSEQQAVVLAKQLLQITNDCKGPDIPGAFRLGGIVYASFETRDELTAEEVNSPQRIVPAGMSWPFGEIAQPLPKEKILLYNGKYKPIQLLKADAKGAVYKAVFIAGFLRLQRCILKEARSNMSSDKFGRNIQDRLEWQHKLYKQLEGKLPIPRPIDLFKMNDDLYFVMELIDGIPLETFIGEQYTGNHSWPALPKPTKLRLLNVLSAILSIVQRLHAEGLIHRDLTPVNLMIGKKDQLWLIDMELTYSIPKNFPSPAFRGGTPGYSSPEQTRHETPTAKEDVYGIGGLMIYFFCGFSPAKLNLSNPQRLSQSLHFLTGDERLSQLIAHCFAINPSARPSVPDISVFIESLKKTINEKTAQLANKTRPLEPESTRQLIESFLGGLADPMMADTQNYWTTLPAGLPGFVAKLNRGYLPPLATGAAGVLYFVAKAHKAGCSAPNLVGLYSHNWEYLRLNFLDTDPILFPGFLEGSAGIALAIKEGLDSGLLPQTQKADLVSIATRCLAALPQRLPISDGLAGNGLVINQTRELLGGALAQDLTLRCISVLLQQQHSKGYWLTVPEMLKKEGLVLGLGFGTAGVLYYLLDCLQNGLCPPEVETSVLHGLEWLMRQAAKSPKQPLWPVATKSKAKNVHNAYSGVSGTLLCFLKAYHYFNDSRYKQIADRAFQSIPPTPYPGDLSQISGLAGIGEVYLEGARLVGDQQWQERADWIARFFHASLLESKECRGYWAMNEHISSSAMLLTGCSGVAHFLLRYLHPERINFCILQS